MFIKVIALLFVALVAGGWMMGSMLVVPAQKKLTASQYTAVEQANTSLGKRYFPIVVIGSIILLGVLLFTVRDNTQQMLLVGGSLVLMIAGLGLTGAKMVPINNAIEKWSVQSPPGDWQKTRDTWHRDHRIRTGFAVLAFILLAFAIVQNSSENGDSRMRAGMQRTTSKRSVS